jgi:hypothetical protein
VIGQQGREVREKREKGQGGMKRERKMMRCNIT